MQLRIWLDDIRPAPNDDWLVVTSVNNATRVLSAIRILKCCCMNAGVEFAELSLDHDLGDFVYDGGDGIKVLDWMAENDFWPTNKPTVHSMNAVGGQQMLALIDRYWPY